MPKQQGTDMAHILVAKDERDIRELIAFTLTFAGHQITQAANGAEALELAPRVKPALILMDVRMPRVGAWVFRFQMERSVQFSPGVDIIGTAKGQDDEVAT